MTLYDHVIWNGYQFNGHWSWIYVARNDPAINGTHIWQWMAEQRADRSAARHACSATPRSISSRTAPASRPDS